MSASPSAGARLLTASDLVYVAGRVLPRSWLVALARLQGRVLYALQRRSAKVVEGNLAEVLRRNGDPSGPRVATRRFFEEQQIRLTLLHMTQRMSTAELREAFPTVGLTYLDQAVAAGKGSFLLLSHLNSMGGFVAVILLRRLGYDVRVAIPDDRDPWAASRLRRLIYRLEGHAPPSLLESMGTFYCQFNIRPIVSALRENAIVVQTGDGWHSASFVEVDFLGRRVPFTNGVLNIAQHSGATVVPAFIAGRAPNLRLVAEEPFTVSGAEDLDRRVAAYAARLEHYVLEHPESWQHFEVERTLDTLVAWKDRPLQDRYAL